MSDRTEKNENNAFLKLAKGKKSCFPDIKEDSEHLRIDNRAQKLLDELKSLTNEQIKAKNEDDVYKIWDIRHLFIFRGDINDPCDYLYKFISHITLSEHHTDKDFEYDYWKMIEKNIGRKLMTQISEDRFYNYYYESDVDKIIESLDWSDVDHYYSPMYLEVVRRNNFKKFIVPSMEIEAESEEEAKQIAASRLVVTSV